MVKAFLAKIFGDKSFGAPKLLPESSGQYPLNPLSSAVTRSADLPVHIVPLQKANELPSQEIISQIEGDEDKHRPNALIVLSREIGNDVCIIRKKEHDAIVLISTILYGTPQGRSVVAKVRDQLSTKNMQMEVSWATPELVREMAHASYITTSSKTNEKEKERYATEPNRKHFLEILRAAVEVEATDVHIELKEDHGLVRFTIDTELWPWDNGRDGVIHKNVAEALMGFAFYFSLDAGSNSDGTYSYSTPINWTITENNFDDHRSFKLRMQSNPKLPEQGPDLIFRLLPIGKSTKEFKFEMMGYSPDQIEELLEALLTAGGLCLIVGIPNSGKTTSIKTAIEAVSGRAHKKFVVLEDPAEYVLPFASHASIQAGVNDEDRANKYAEALAGWLRGNPHVISMGEIRDKASAFGTMTAAEIGCMGFATLHANSMMGIFDRLTENFIGLDLNSITDIKKMKIFVYQKLMPVLCKECRIPFSQSPLKSRDHIRKVGDKLKVDVTGVFFRRIGKKDCPVCQGRGVKGMTLVAEVYAPTEEFMHFVKHKDMLNARREWEKFSDGALDSPCMTGKSVLHHGFYKMLIGELDPMNVRELGRFESLLDTIKGEKNMKVGT